MKSCEVWSAPRIYIRMRAREYLRQWPPDFRADWTTSASDGEIIQHARDEDGVALTCIGDIQREREAGLGRFRRGWL